MVLKPWEGAKSEGAIGFLKGVGKGLIGVVAKPVGGVIDMTTSALDMVRTAAQVSFLIFCEQKNVKMN